MTTSPGTNHTDDPPALHRAELRDPALVHNLGGVTVLEAARRAGRIFDNLDDLVAAGYDPDTRRPRTDPAPPAA